MSERKPVQSHDLAILRRSLTAGPLPTDQTEWLIAETARLVLDRDQIAEAVGRLSEPWADVRSVLNEIHRLLGR